MPRRNDHSAAQKRAMILEACSDLIREKGFEGVRARPIAQRIGYAVGTLYNAFEDLDEIVESVNAETARKLFEACVDGPISENPGEALMVLAQRYRYFVEKEPQLWNAVVAYPFPADRPRGEVYLEEIQKVFDLIYQVTSPLYGPEEQKLQIHDARVLWSCLYGVSALSDTARYPDTSTEDLVSTIVEMYIAMRNRE